MVVKFGSPLFLYWDCVSICLMSNPSERTRFITLVIGDVICLAIITIVGFVRHGTLESGGLRILITFVPVVIAWYLVSPFLGVYDLKKAMNPRELWRPFWAMAVAGPLAAWLRGVWLNSAILPIFVLVLTGFDSVALLVWRGIFLLTFNRSRHPYG